MTTENIFSYLEYLALSIEQLGEAVVEREEEAAVYEARLAQMGDALIQAQKEIDKADARAALAESKVAKLQEKLEEMTIAAKATKTRSTPQEPQNDLFSASWATPAPVPSKPSRVANDENALILAKKLDSTIDKVQRLLREAK